MYEHQGLIDAATGLANRQDLIKTRLERVERLLSVLQNGKCKEHPKYRVKRPPKSNCDFCWLLWTIETEHKKAKKVRKELQ